MSISNNNSSQFNKSYVRIGQYIFNESSLLGCGTFGKVYKGSLASGTLLRQPEYYAIKQLDIEKMSVNGLSLSDAVVKLNKEIELMKDLNHPHVSKYIDAVRSDKHVYIVMNLCNGGNLQDLVIRENPNEQRCLKLFAQLLSGIKYLLQEKMIFHRDIKPQNILLHNGNVQICDFGVSRKLSSNANAQYRTVTGTPLFSSPQILRGEPYTTKTDIWSLGITLYFMLYYRPSAKRIEDNNNELCQEFFPWQGKSGVMLARAIEKQPKLRFLDDVNHVSDDTKALLKGMLRFQEENRFSFEDVFEHKYFKDKLISSGEGGNKGMEGSVEKRTKERELELAASAREGIQRCFLLCDLIEQILREWEGIGKIQMEDYFKGEKNQILLVKSALVNHHFQKINELVSLFDPVCDEGLLALQRTASIEFENFLVSLRKRVKSSRAQRDTIEKIILRDIGYFGNLEELFQKRFKINGQREILQKGLEVLFVGLKRIRDILVQDKEEISSEDLKYLHFLDDLLIVYGIDFDELQITQMIGTSQEISQILEPSKTRTISSPFSLFSRITQAYNNIFASSFLQHSFSQSVL